ncbi:MAG: Rnf-Nqr domain containing protein [candidate division WOR-3 bacterium]
MNNNLLNIFIDAVFGKNIVLYYLLGLCPLILYKTSIKESFVIGTNLTIIMVVCSFVSVFVNNLLLIPFNLGYLKILFIILIIYLIIYCGKVLLSKFSPNLSALFDNYPEFFFTNYALYGVIFLNISFKSRVLPAVLSSFGFGIGYLILTIIFMAIKEKLRFEQKTTALKNIYLELIILGLISLVIFSIIGLK